MSASAAPPGRLSVREFLSWSDDQTSGGCELIDGIVVAMAPERIAHARRKLVICQRLQSAIAEGGLACEAFIDGVGVAIGDSTVFIPDVIVRCGDELDDTATIVPDPLIIVEVLSPSTRAVDTALKLERYFQLPSLVHYLVASTTTPATLHYRRTPEGITMQIVSGLLQLDPPGITINLA